MSRSPERNSKPDVSYPLSEVSIHTQFNVKIGKRSCSVSTADLKTRDTLERLGSKICGKKRRVDVNPSCTCSIIEGCKNKQTKLSVVCGALFIVGPSLCHVLGFAPVNVKITFAPSESKEPLEKMYFVRKMSYCVIKGRAIRQVQVSKKHIVLDDEEYHALATTKSFIGTRKKLLVPFKKIALSMVEDSVSVLCHCGIRLSRSALETHLRPDFGPLSGAIKEFPIVGVEDVSFSVCHFTGGILERVAEPGASPNTWKLHFDPKISGTFKVYTNTRLVLGETTVVEKGVPTILSLTGNFTLAQQMPVFGNCMVVHITLTDGKKQFIAQNIRLPLMSSKSLLCLNRQHFHGFVGVEGSLMKPRCKFDSSHCLYYSDATLDALAGKKQVLPYNQKKLFELSLRRLKRS